MRKFLFALFLTSLCCAGIFILSRFSQKVEKSPKPTFTAERRHLSGAAGNKLASPTRTSASPEIVYVTNRFNWSQVESSDYRQYIANLRAIGCPESTIKDIIFTDILKLYAARRGKFYTNGRAFHFWETNEKRKLNARQLEERERQLALIDKEIPAVLRELLGVNYEREMNKYFVDTNEDERRLDFLPEEKRDQLLALRDRIEGMRERILDRSNGNPSPEDVDELGKIDALRDRELGRLLSGSELAEFELRTSPTADRLREELIGFNPSETEFRKIFELEKALDKKFAFTDESDPAAMQEKEEAEQSVQDALRETLGEARYAEFLRAKNPDYRSAVVFTEIYELPVSTAQAIFEIKQVAETERQNLLSNPAVQEADRLLALHVIRDETEKALRAAMGDKNFSSYQQGTGRWVKNLSSAN